MGRSALGFEECLEKLSLLKFEGCFGLEKEKERKKPTEHHDAT